MYTHIHAATHFCFHVDFINFYHIWLQVFVSKFAEMKLLSFIVREQTETVSRHKLVIDPNISHINLCSCCRPVLKQEQIKKTGFRGFIVLSFTFFVSVCFLCLSSSLSFSRSSFISRSDSPLVSLKQPDEQMR